MRWRVPMSVSARALVCKSRTKSGPPARNTAFTFKGENIDAKQIGKELGVRYVLEGSVQRDQSRARVNAQLIDTGSGAHLWADRFDEDVADLFKLQDEVVARLAGSLGFALTNAEAERGARSNNPDVIDLTMRGSTLMWRIAQQTANDRRESVEKARALFDQALKIEPNDPDALAGTPILMTFSMGGPTLRRTTKPKCSGKPIAQLRSPPTMCGRIS
jgi:adenylate cyclase